MTSRPILLFIIVLGFSPSALAEKADTIIQKYQATQITQGDEVIKGQLVLYNSRDKTVGTRDFIWQHLVQQSRHYSLVIITAPPDLAGVKLLSHEKKGRAAQHWLHLPSTKTTRRIAGPASRGSFLGSEFSYADLSTLEFDSYRHDYLRESPCGGSICHVIAAQKPGSLKKALLWIRNKDLSLARLEMINGKTRKKSVLKIKSRRLNQALKPSSFTKQALER